MLVHPLSGLQYAALPMQALLSAAEVATIRHRGLDELINVQPGGSQGGAGWPKQTAVNQVTKSRAAIEKAGGGVKSEAELGAMVDANGVPMVMLETLFELMIKDNLPACVADPDRGVYLTKKGQKVMRRGIDPKGTKANCWSNACSQCDRGGEVGGELVRAFAKCKNCL